MKICLNCGDKLLDAATKCPTCGNKKDFAFVDKEDGAKIREIIASTPHPKEGLTPKWQNALIMRSVEEKAAKQALKRRLRENLANGIACCPKCVFSSLTARKEGFNFFQGALGAAFGRDSAMIADGIGANKVIITCLLCGYPWTP